MPAIPEVSPSFRAIVDALAKDIEEGRLRAGDRLPPQRELAYTLSVNLSTISRAYQEASRRRLIGGEVGRGTFVLASSAEAKLFALKQPALQRLDLSTNVPVVMPSDGSAIIDTLQSLSDEERREATQYHSPQLLDRARSAIHLWLAKRGYDATGKTIIPCAGAHAALQVLLLEKTRPNDPILVESFTFPGMKVLARQLQLRLIPIEQDAEGITPEGLEAAAGGSAAKFAVLVPNLQNPTGAIMGDKRRRAIADIVLSQGLNVIEDDVYGAFSNGPPLAHDLGRQGLLVSSLSKTVMPGLRFGFLCGDDELLEPLHDSLHLTSWLMSPLAMTIGSTWIEDGTAEERTLWQKEEMLRRWKLMIAILGPSASNPAPHVWLDVGEDPDLITMRAKEMGVEIVSANLFAAGRRSAKKVRVCLTAARTTEELARGLQVLAELGARP